MQDLSIILEYNHFGGVEAARDVPTLLVVEQPIRCVISD